VVEVVMEVEMVMVEVEVVMVGVEVVMLMAMRIMERECREKDERTFL
jgi:hypothetical protein